MTQMVRLYLREIGCEDGRWMELAQVRVQWRALVSAALNLQFCYHSVSKMDLMEIGCEDGRWMELAQVRVQWRALVPAALNLQFCYHSAVI
jgi:hypothetical protein